MIADMQIFQLYKWSGCALMESASQEAAQDDLLSLPNPSCETNPLYFFHSLLSAPAGPSAFLKEAKISRHSPRPHRAAVTDAHAHSHNRPASDTENTYISFGAGSYFAYTHG